MTMRAARRVLTSILATSALMATACSEKTNIHSGMGPGPERAMLARLLAAHPLRGRVRPLVSLSVDMRDVYAATHWVPALP